MILKINVDRADILLWARFSQYKVDAIAELTKSQIARQFIDDLFSDGIANAKLKQDKQAVRKRPSNVMVTLDEI